MLTVMEVWYCYCAIHAHLFVCLNKEGCFFIQTILKPNFLIDRLGPDILWKDKFCIVRERRLKVPGWSLVWNELLTKKLPMFFFTFEWNEWRLRKDSTISGSFWSNLKFLRIMDLTEWLWGGKVRVNGMRSECCLCDAWSDDCRSPLLTMESRKTLEQKFIFQIGTLNPIGINERFWFY